MLWELLLQILDSLVSRLCRVTVSAGRCASTNVLTQAAISRRIARVRRGAKSLAFDVQVEMILPVCQLYDKSLMRSWVAFWLCQ